VYLLWCLLISSEPSSVGEGYGCTALGPVWQGSRARVSALFYRLQLHSSTTLSVEPLCPCGCLSGRLAPDP